NNLHNSQFKVYLVINELKSFFLVQFLTLLVLDITCLDKTHLRLLTKEHVYAQGLLHNVYESERQSDIHLS
ncbi:MAG: hypothetical protein ACFFAY_11255, partial [Promethearchaeota archaeon]